MKMNSVVATGFGIPVLVSGSWLFAAESVQQKPNVVIVLADDLGYGSVGCYGAPEKVVQTPHIDRLAKDGMRFTDASAPGSICTPTRYALLTGRYCWRSRQKVGVVNVFDPLLIDPALPNLARLMQDNGYASAMIGKWHLGYRTEEQLDYRKELKPGPLELGFDYQFAVPQNNGDMTGIYVENHHIVGLRSNKLTPNPPMTHYGGPYVGYDAPQRDEPENMTVLTDKALAWLETVPEDKPFFLYFAATAVHFPILQSTRVKGTTGGGDYTDFIYELDETVRRLDEAIKAKGARRNTLFIFTSDNGGVIPGDKSKHGAAEREAIEKGLKLNGEWRGRKHSIYEGGFRVPFIARWPESIPPGTTCSSMINLSDVYATVAELLKAPMPDSSKGAEDSISFLPLLRDPTGEAPRTSIVLQSVSGNFAVRKGPWKYIEGKVHPSRKHQQGKGENVPQLYNLKDDPNERNNVLKQNPKIVTALARELKSIRNGEHLNAAEKQDATPAVKGLRTPSAYDVTWTTPSKNHHGSMPLGNGTTGLNAWVEPNGDLCFYIGRTDSWGDNGRLLKVGKVRVTLDPAPRVQPFEQTLSLTDATMVVRYGGDSATVLKVWVDANHPVVHVTVDAPVQTTATAAIELWRTEATPLPVLENSDVMRHNGKPGDMHEPVIVEPDTVLADQADRVGWYHRNLKSKGPGITAGIQGLTGFEREDPLLHRIFGAVITCDNPKRLDNLRLQSKSGKHHVFSIFVDTLHPATEAQWLARMDAHRKAVGAIGFDDRLAAHRAWWKQRWNLSWIDAKVHGDGATPSEESDVDDAQRISRGYALQRFISICGGRGQYPVKFNGSIFNVAYEGKPGDADYRRWGPGYWWQNTRLPYIGLTTSGDTDLMTALFEQYIDRFLPLNLYRTKHYFNHGGAFYSEVSYFWGDVCSQPYGWTPMEERQDPLQESPWHKWEWVAGPELVYMALDYYEHTGDEAFLKEKILPTADAVITFFDAHYKTDKDGKLVMHPSQALETWWECTNPLPEIAGLHAVVNRLLALDTALVPAGLRTHWQGFREKIPELPMREIDGKPAFAPAEHFANKRNSENPELYAVFPFRLSSFNRANAAPGRHALEHRLHKGFNGWRQDDIMMAYLGLVEDTRKAIIHRAGKYDETQRFPAFWGPNYDWTPDQTHGGVLMKTFQAMLMQAEPRDGSAFAGKIYLLPAWPRNWDVNFKLHAPDKTIVQGSVRGGKLVDLAVTPESRRQDVVVAKGFE